MAFSFVQSIDTYSTSNLQLTGVGAGNLLVAFVSAQATLASITVSGGGTWTALTEFRNTVYSTFARLYYCLSATGGNSTFSLSGSPSDGGWVVLEFSKSGSASFDSLTTSSQDLNLTTFSSGNITINNNNSLMVACLADEFDAVGISWDTGWVEQEEDLSHVHSCAYRIIENSGTYTASGTRASASESSALGTVVFYESGASSPTALPRRALDGPFYGSLRGSVR